MRFLFKLLTQCLILFSTFSYAGERLSFEVKQPQTKENISVFVQGEQARIITSANTNSALIFDASVRQLRILDHSKKSVTTLDQASLEQIASVAEGLGNIAKSQGGVLGDLFSTFGLSNDLGKVAKIETKALPDLHKISGLSCQMQQVYKDSVLVTQLCFSQDNSMQTREQTTLKDLIEFAQVLVNKGQIVLEQFGLPVPVIPENLVKGIPVFIENTESKLSATLTEIKAVDVQPGQFAIPKGYTKNEFGF